MDFNKYLEQGGIFWQKKEYAKAIESYEAALKIEPDHTELKEAIERMKIDAVKLADIQKQMSEACVNEAKTRAGLMEELYGIKLEIADVDKIIAEYSQAPNCNHDLAKNILALAYYISGLLFDSKMEYAEAVKAYSEAINNEPNYPLALKRRGQANLEIGEIENCNQAIEDFNKAGLDEAKLNEMLADAYWQLAVAYDNKGERDKVVENCERILKLNPNNDNARELLNMAKEAMQG